MDERRGSQHRLQSSGMPFGSISASRSAIATSGICSLSVVWMCPTRRCGDGYLSSGRYRFSRIASHRADSTQETAHHQTSSNASQNPTLTVDDRASGCAWKVGKDRDAYMPTRRRPDIPSALERSNCGGKSTSRLERADQGWRSLIGPTDFANAARSPAGAFGATDVAPSGAFLDACTCWKTRLAMNSRNGI